MNTNRWLKRLLGYVGMPLVIVLFLYLIWRGSNGRGFWEVSTGIGLMLVLGTMLYLRHMENISERDITRRIQAEYPPESQPQVFETYEHLKIKELQGLFSKILDDAKGDPNQVRKLASVAESVGWKAFLENHW